MELLRKIFSREQPLKQESPSSSSPGEDMNDAFTLVQGNGDSEEDIILEYIPIRFLENRIQTLSRISVPHDLNRLLQHKVNMTSHHASGDWDRLNSEQLNASRTVQQLKVHLETIDELRQQVRPTDLVPFDLLTLTLREDISSAVKDYQMMTADIESEVGGAGGGAEGGGGGGERQMLLMERKDEDHYQSLESLRTDLLELNDLVQRLNCTVSEHSQRVAMVSKRSESATVGVHSGLSGLQGAQRLKAYVLPVGGAIVGGVLGGAVGGPIGIFAGLKIGALTAATATTAGALGGAFIGYRVRENAATTTTTTTTAGGAGGSDYNSQQQKKNN